MSACISSIFEHYGDYLQRKEFEIIVVDNGSSDTTVSDLLEKFKDTISIIKNSTNSGFAKACNKGAKKALGKYLFFLNSDTNVEDRGIIEMVTYLESNNRVGILGAQMQDKNKHFEKSAGNFFTLFQTLLMLFSLERLGFVRSAPRKIQQVDWVSGGAMMVKKNLFEKLGGFDEHFFMYLEDMEFCFRAKKQGVKTFFFPDVTIIHVKHASGSRTFAIVNIYQGLLYFYRKQKPFWQYKCIKFVLQVKAHMLSVSGRFFGNKYLLETYKSILK